MTETIVTLTAGPAGNPACGDLWKAEDGSLILVDYTDWLNIGVTTSAGERIGFNYREGFARWLHDNKKAQYLWRQTWPWEPSDMNHPTRAEAENILSETAEMVANRGPLPPAVAESIRQVEKDAKERHDAWPEYEMTENEDAAKVQDWIRRPLARSHDVP